MDMYEELSRLPREIVANYRKSGHSQGISEKLKLYIERLDRAMETFHQERSIRQAAIQLNASYKDISFNTCRNLIYDAINYFHLDNNVTEEAWCLYYADYYDDLSKKAEGEGDFKEARLSAKQAVELRLQASKVSVDPELLRPKDQVINPDISAGRLGLDEHNLKKLWIDSETFIEELPIDPVNKERIKKEARDNLGIKDVDYEQAD